MAEAQLMFSGEISLAWNAPLACQTAVGLGLVGGASDELDFLDLPTSVMPSPPNCSSFSGALQTAKCCTTLLVTCHGSIGLLPVSEHPCIYEFSNEDFSSLDIELEYELLFGQPETKLGILCP